MIRIKLLYYLQHEILADLCDPISNGISCREAQFSPPIQDGYPGMPDWWDEDADKSLLMGVYKHGYDRHNLMRQDPALCFLSRCGPPDGAAVLAELQASDDLVKNLEEEEPDAPPTPSSLEISKAALSSNVEQEQISRESPDGKLIFPSSTDLNRRFRNLITAYQRYQANTKRKQERLEKLERTEAAVREKENRRREQAQRKWSKREEADFFRTVSSFGVEYSKETKQYDWSKFRVLSKLDRKMDESLTEYYKAFYVMCKRVLGRPLTAEEESLQFTIDSITEERANRALQRIDLLNKIREEVLPHPELEERLSLCQSSIELPDWWICGKHDKDLLVGAAKYGLNRLDYHLMNDSDLSFINILRAEEAEHKAEAEKMANLQSQGEPSTIAGTDDLEKVPSDTEKIENVCNKSPEPMDKTEETDISETTKEPDEVEQNPALIESEKKESEEDDQKTVLKSDEPSIQEQPVDEVSSAEEQPQKPSTEDIGENESSAREMEESKSLEPISDDDFAEPKSESEKDEESQNFDQDRPKSSAENKVEEEEKMEVDEQSTENQVDMDKPSSEDQLKESTDISMKEETEPTVSDEGRKSTLDDTTEKATEADQTEDKTEVKECSDEVAQDPQAEPSSGPESSTQPENNEISENPANLEDEKPEKPTEATNDEIPKAQIIENDKEQSDCDKTTEETTVENESVENKSNENETLEPSAPKQDENSSEDKVADVEGPKNPEVDEAAQESTSKEAALPPTSTATINPNIDSDVSVNNPSNPNHLLTHGAVRWPKDRVLQARLEQICYCVEKNEWPSPRQTFFPNIISGAISSSTPSVATAESSPRAASPQSISSMSREPTPHQTPDNTPRRESISPSPDFFYHGDAVPTPVSF